VPTPPPIRRADPRVYEPQLARPAGAPRKRLVRTGPPPLSPRAARASALLLLGGAGLTLGGVFPPYLRTGGALSAELYKAGFVTIPAVAWALAAVLLLTARPDRVRWGTALAAGSVWIATGLDLAAVGQLVATGFHPADTGYWLVIGGNVLALVGVVTAIVALRRAALLGGPSTGRKGPASLLLLAAGAAAVIGYLPGWRHYRLTARTLRHAEHLTTPGPFNGPWEVIAAEVVIVAGLGLGPVIVSRWGDLRAAGAALLGSVLGLGGLLALNVGEVATAKPQAFVQAAEVKTLHVRLFASMTGAFWLEATAVAVLFVTGAVAVAVGRPTDRPDLTVGVLRPAKRARHHHGPVGPGGVSR
jgi:hypothetical protein